MGNYDVCFLVGADTKHEGRIRFFANVAKELSSMENRTLLITSTDLQTQIAEKENASCINIEKMSKEYNYGNENSFESMINQIEQYYGVSLRRLVMPEMLQKWERATNSWKHEQKYLERIVRYFPVLDKIFNEYRVRYLFEGIGPYVLFRAAYHVALEKGIETFFFGPSSYNDKGVLFYRDEMLTPDSIVGIPREVSDDLKQKIEQRINEMKQQKEVPDYFAPLQLRSEIGKKLIDIPKSFGGKLGILRRLWRGTKRVLSIQYGKRLYQQFNPSERYFFFPLHLQLETQIFLRAEPFIYQEFLVEHIARNLPYGYTLYVKEHPNAMGLYTFSALKRIARSPSVKLIPPQMNPHSLIANAQAVITINSTTGFEALMHDKPVITFGRPFYAGNPNVFSVSNLFDTAEALRKALRTEIDHEANISFLAKIYKASSEARYHRVKDSEKDKVQALAQAMKKAIHSTGGLRNEA